MSEATKTIPAPAKRLTVKEICEAIACMMRTEREHLLAVLLTYEGMDDEPVKTQFELAMDDLNGRQRAFVREYLVSKNATRAAESAEYSPKTAAQNGSRMLRNVKVKRAIETAEIPLMEQLGITHRFVLERLKHQATRRDPGATHGGCVRATIALGLANGVLRRTDDGAVAQHKGFAEVAREFEGKDEKAAIDALNDLELAGGGGK